MIQRLSGLICLLLLLSVPNSAWPAGGTDESWQQWQTFREAFMSKDGRIIDPGSEQLITTSEGQAYSLFFALVAGDEENFALLLKWTTNNLADGNLSKKLPAWLWGRNDEGKWTVLDDNAASDVDLWLAYTLIEAGRIWKRDDYTRLGKSLSQLILEQEVVKIPGLGATLLPGPYGFADGAGTYKLNPSYSPVQLLRYMGSIDPSWQKVLPSSLTLLKESAPRGFSPDWVTYRAGKGFIGYEKNGHLGSYNAIRVYLWAGMMHEKDPERKPLLSRFAPMKEYIEESGRVPEQVNTFTGVTKNTGPIGFSAAMLPFLLSSGSDRGLVSELSRLIERPLSEDLKSYYNQVLGLFGLGWYQKKFCFSAQGQLQLGEMCR